MRLYLILILLASCSVSEPVDTGIPEMPETAQAPAEPPRTPDRYAWEIYDPFR